MLIPHNWDVPSAIRSRLGKHSYGRQRAICEEGHVLLVLHRPPTPNDSARLGVLFWRTPSGTWKSTRGEEGALDLKRHVDSLAEAEQKISREYEKSPNLETLFDMIEFLARLSRGARNMHQALQTAREYAKEDAFLIEMRDAAYEIERNFELLLEDVRNAVQQKVAKETELQAVHSREALRASHRLNMLAAFFFPLTAMGSLFGMNLTHGLSSTSPVVFWAILCIGAGLGYAVKGWVVASNPNKDMKRR